MVSASGFSFEKHTFMFNKLLYNRLIFKLSTKAITFFMGLMKVCFKISVFFFQMANFIHEQRKPLS